MNIAIYGKKYNSDFFSGFSELLKTLAENKVQVFIHRELHNQLPGEITTLAAAKVFENKEDIEGKVDFLFSIGGDGTLLQSALLVGSSGIFNKVAESPNEVDSIHLIKGVDSGQVENHLHIEGPFFAASLWIYLFHSSTELL